MVGLTILWAMIQDASPRKEMKQQSADHPHPHPAQHSCLDQDWESAPKAGKQPTTYKCGLASKKWVGQINISLPGVWLGKHEVTEAINSNENYN